MQGAGSDQQPVGLDLWPVAAGCAGERAPRCFVGRDNWWRFRRFFERKRGVSGGRVQPGVGGGTWDPGCDGHRLCSTSRDADCAPALRIPSWDTFATSPRLAAVRKRPPISERLAFQELLRQTRVDAVLSQVELARSLGRSQSFVSKYESGERRLDVLELKEVCTALGISVTTFVRRLENVLRSTR